MAPGRGALFLPSRVLLVSVLAHGASAVVSGRASQRSALVNPDLVVSGIDSAELDAEAAISAAEALSAQALAAPAPERAALAPAEPRHRHAKRRAPAALSHPPTRALTGVRAQSSVLAGAPSPVEPVAPSAAKPAEEEKGAGSGSDAGAPSAAPEATERAGEDAEEAEAKAEADEELRIADEEDKAERGDGDKTGDETKQDVETTTVEKTTATTTTTTEKIQRSSKHEDQEEADDSVEKLQRAVAKETKSEALAHLLGSLKMDMIELKGKVANLQKDVSDGVEVQEDPGQTLVYPVSVSMQCVLGLSALYFVIYTLRALCKVVVDGFALPENTLVESALRVASETVFFAPMLCVLFLGAHLRAEQISQGKQGPPPAAEAGMRAASWSVFVQTLLVLAIPIFTGETPTVTEEGIKFPSQENRAIAGLLTVIQGAAMAALYLGVCVVCVVVVLMDARSLDVRPVDIWDDPTTVRTEYAPQLTAAMQNTIGLAQLFFFVYLTHGILNSIVQLIGQATLPTLRAEQPNLRQLVASWEQCFRVCTNAVGLAPMVCVLFMTSRLRALEIDPKEGVPQWWADILANICTASLCLQVAIVLLAHLGGLESERVTAMDARPSSRAVLGTMGESDLEELSCAEANNSERLIIAVRMGLSFVMYGCVAGICASAITLEGEKSQPSPPFGPTLICVLLLCALYFTISLGLLVTQAVALATFSMTTAVSQAGVATLLRLVRLFKMAECVVRFCPMLALLFLGARTRALVMSDFEGSPQCWAQDAMYASVAALSIQLLTVLVSASLSRHIEVDAEGSPSSEKITYVPGRLFLELLKGVAFVALYGGVLLVGASVWVIRPETAACVERGFMPLPHVR